MINGFKTYILYLSMKTHFNKDSYDYFKFSGEVSASYESFQKRNDKYIFEKAAKYYPTKKRLVGFLVSNFIKEKNFYIGDFNNNICEKNYQEWLGRTESLVYIFEQDMRKVHEESENLDVTFRDIFKIKTGNITSRFLEMALEGILCLETYIIVDKLLGLDEYYKDEVLDPLYEEFSFKIRKYSPFIQLDRPKFSQIFSRNI